MGYVGVLNSDTLQNFGQQQMAQPGPRAKLETRTFIHLEPEEVLGRKEEVGQVKTLAGIKAKYEYICLPDRKGDVVPLPLLLLFLHEPGVGGVHGAPAGW